MAKRMKWKNSFIEGKIAEIMVSSMPSVDPIDELAEYRFREGESLTLAEYREAVQQDAAARLDALKQLSRMFPDETQLRDITEEAWTAANKRKV